MSIGSISAAGAYLAQSYRSSQTELAESLARLGSNQRFQTASQDFTSFASVAKIRGQIGVADAVYTTANKASGQMEAYDGWATAMMDMLVELKDANASGDTNRANGIANAITELNAAQYDGAAINAGSQGNMTYFDGTSAALGVAAVTITGTTASVDGDIANLATFANKVSDVKATADSLSAAASAIKSTNQVAIDQIYKIDEAAEMARYTAADIKQQTSLAMIAQGNTSKQSILLLFR